MAAVPELKFKDKTVTLDTTVGELYGDDTPDEKNKHVLTRDLEKLFKLTKSTENIDLRHFWTNYFHDHNQYIDIKKGAEGKEEKVLLSVPDDKLLELGQYSLHHLEEQRLWNLAYNLVYYTGHVSMALGAVEIATAQRTLGKTLAEKKHTSSGADPIDIMQGVDAFLKGGVLTAYTLMRLAPHHEYGKDEHGWHKARHIAQNLYHDTKGMGAELMTSDYLKQMWKVFAIVDVFLNLPGHFLATGKPVEELKREAGKLAHGAEETTDALIHNMHEQGGGLIHGLLTHTPVLSGMYKKHLEHIVSALPTDLDTHKSMSGIAKDMMGQAVNQVDDATYDGAHQESSRKDNRTGALLKTRREYWQNLLHTQDLSVIVGYLGKAGVAGLDILKVYPRIAQKDLLHASTVRGYYKIGGT
jgi:hypothetical protein